MSTTDGGMTSKESDDEERLVRWMRMEEWRTGRILHRQTYWMGSSVFLEGDAFEEEWGVENERSLDDVSSFQERRGTESYYYLTPQQPELDYEDDWSDRGLKSVYRGEI